MPYSVVDLYQKILPKTNCGDCGYSTCLAFASMVVAEKVPLKMCPHLAVDVLQGCQAELDAQHAGGKWVKKDMASDALIWAKQRSASMKIEDLPVRIGGRLLPEKDGWALELPYFADAVIIKKNGIVRRDGAELNRWEQVFLYNHMAMGGSRQPSGNWKAMEELPNTVSKIKSMRSHVEAPLIDRFHGQTDVLMPAARHLGGTQRADTKHLADVVAHFQVLPRIPVMLLFWDEDIGEGFSARVKLLFDETIIEHLDIESILFLSETLSRGLIAAAQ
ncbi:MAG: DUF3786 domain-containing protein [Deltaproteobacteria bacterium]|jgi:hypothetical protein